MSVAIPQSFTPLLSSAIVFGSWLIASAMAVQFVQLCSRQVVPDLLINRTQQSTQEIQDMITRLQEGTGKAVKVMETAQGQAQASSELVEKAAESLGMIAGSVSAINDMNSMIASAVEEQSSVTAEMQVNMNNIREVADRSAEGAQQTAQASEELARLAAEQQSLVAQFKI